MAKTINVSVYVPPDRERYVAEISLDSNESPPEGYDGTTTPIGAVIIENGQLEFEVYVNEKGDCRILNCKEFIEALNEGMNRLVEIYPQYSEF